MNGSRRFVVNSVSQLQPKTMPSRFAGGRQLRLYGHCESLYDVLTEKCPGGHRRENKGIYVVTGSFRQSGSRSYVLSRYQDFGSFLVEGSWNRRCRVTDCRSRLPGFLI